MLREAGLDGQVVHEEGINVSRCIKGFTGIAGTVAGLSIDADECRIRGARRLLQSGGVFEGMSRYYTVIMVGGGDECRRIGPTGNNVV